MLPTTREIRVFFSSTFQGMDAERRYLAKVVFPRVRAACQAREVGFNDIDLRWGVSEVDAQNGLTVAICLKEIERCRSFPPFFIGFLGQRYGWPPAGSGIPMTFRHKSSKKQCSGGAVIELEMEFAVLGRPGAPLPRA
jgi:hypothetical protein